MCHNIFYGMPETHETENDANATAQKFSAKNSTPCDTISADTELQYYEPKSCSLQNTESSKSSDTNDQLLQPTNHISTEHRTDASTSNTIRIATFNMKNFYANNAYLLEMTEKVDIICIQEHWLFDFEKCKLESFNGCHSIVKCVDRNDPISPYQRVRGYGGSAIMWKDKLHKYITSTDEGRNRLAIIIIHQNQLQPICIISAYMPSKGNKTYNSEYMETLDQIEEVLIKYGNTHHILLCGDMNASLHSDTPDHRDRIFGKFCKRMNLLLCENYPHGFTYIHENGQKQSQIDYILSTYENLSNISSITILEETPSNTSDHKALMAVMNVNVAISKHTQEKNDELKTPCPRTNWSKIDIDAYETYLNEHMVIFQPTENTKFEIIQAINYLCYILNCATVLARNGSQNPKKSKGGILRLTPDVKDCVMRSKNAHWEWKMAGKPDKNHHTYKRKQSAKSELRRIQRVNAAIERQNTYSDIMQATKDDSKTFYKLVRKQRGNSNTATSELIYDEKVCETPSDICKGFFEYFQELALPKSDDLFDEKYKEDVELDYLIIEEIT